MKKITLLFTAVVSSMVLSAQTPKRVIMEDFTGTWCGYCPYGKTYMEESIATYPTAIGMEVHNGDTYANSYSDAITSGMNVSGFPAGAIDRFAFGTSDGSFDVGQFKSKTGTRMNTTAKVGVNFTSTYNTGTKALSVTVTVNFVAAVSGDLRINCLLAEDGVVTPSDPQHNYMNGDVGDPWYGMGDEMPNYVHNGVARVNLAGNWGTTGVIPASVTSGSTYSKTYTYTVPSGWNASKLYIVAFVEKYGSAVTAHEILNANRGLIGTSTGTSTGISENNGNQILVKQNSPNPFKDVTAIQFQLNTTDNVSLKVYNAFGQLVNNVIDTKLVPGDHTFYWTGTDNDGKAVSGGIYYYTISTSSQQITKPMIFVGQ